MISNDTSLPIGDTAMFTCIGQGLPDVQIIWSRDGENIVNDSLVAIYDEDVTQGGTRFSLSILELCSVQSSDTGIYVCNVISGQAIANATTQLIVTGKKTINKQCKISLNFQQELLIMN